MALNAGEVETVLRLRDELSGQLERPRDALGRFGKTGTEVSEVAKGLTTGFTGVGTAAGGVVPPTEAGTMSFGKMALSFAAGFATIQVLQRGLRELAAFVGSSVTAYAEQEMAVSKLNAALKAQGLATPSVVLGYQEMASQFQRTTVYADELLNNMQALLIQIGGVMPSQMRAALQAATNLASGLGIDLHAATVLVAKAFAGKTETMGRYGIVLDEAKVKSQGMTYVLAEIEKKFGGQAVAQMDTYTGRVAAMSNAWGEFKEMIGSVVVNNPATVAALNLLSESTGNVAARATSAKDAWVVFAQALLPGSGAILALISGHQEADQSIRAVTKSVLAAESPFQKMARVIEETGTPLKDVAANVAKFRAELEEKIKADEKAAKAAEAHGEAVKSLAESFIGTKVAAEVRMLSDALTLLSREGPVTNKALRAVGEAAAELYQKGGEVDDTLFRLAMQSGKLDIALEMNLAPTVQGITVDIAAMSRELDISLAKMKATEQAAQDFYDQIDADQRRLNEISAQVAKSPTGVLGAGTAGKWSGYGGVTQTPAQQWAWFDRAMADFNANVARGGWGIGAMPVPPTMPSVPRMAAGGYVKQDTLAHLHAGEKVVPLGKGGETMIVQLVMPDGRELARAVVPWVPGELRRIGVA